MGGGRMDDQRHAPAALPSVKILGLVHSFAISVPLSASKALRTAGGFSRNAAHTEHAHVSSYDMKFPAHKFSRLNAKKDIFSFVCRAECLSFS